MVLLASVRHPEVDRSSGFVRSDRSHPELPEDDGPRPLPPRSGDDSRAGRPRGPRTDQGADGACVRGSRLVDSPGLAPVGRTLAAGEVLEERTTKLPRVELLDRGLRVGERAAGDAEELDHT